MSTRLFAGPAALAAAALLAAAPAGAALASPHSGSPPAAMSGWTTLNTQNVGPLSQLNSASALSPSDVWAVGDSGFPGFNSRPLTEHWNGSTWTVVPVPVPAGIATGQLQGVSGASPDDVWAVGGFVKETGAGGVFLLHWNGTAWRQMTPPTGMQSPQAVDARSAADVWVVGGSTADHWNGTAWTVFPIPNPHPQVAGNIELLAVSADSPADAWATGEFPDQKDQPHSVILHWNGTAWTQAAHPGTGPNSQLDGVTALSPTDAWTVGNDATADGTPQALFEHWNGTTWTTVPGAKAPLAQLQGVAAVSPTDVWAVGQAGGPNGDDQTLAEHWNGTTWTVSPTPHSAKTGVMSDFPAITATPTTVFAVGNLFPFSSHDDLALAETHAA